MENQKAFNMCLGEAYCLECGKKKYFNSNDPFTMPSKCQHCGGEMTTDQKEKFMKFFKDGLKYKYDETQRHDLVEILKLQKELRKKNRTEVDQFIIDLLESLKNNFINDNQYYGSEIKLIINGFIKRME